MIRLKNMKRNPLIKIITSNLTLVLKHSFFFPKNGFVSYASHVRAESKKYKSSLPKEKSCLKKP